MLPEVIATAAATMLSPFCPGLTGDNLKTMLANYQQSHRAAPIVKPLTRHEAAEILQVSLATVNRYMKAGTLKAVKIGKRAVRISAESVQSLLVNGCPATVSAATGDTDNAPKA